MNQSPDRVIIKFKAGGIPVTASELAVTAGLTIEDIAFKYHGGCDGIQAFVRGVGAEWEPIPRDMWHRVRPRSDNDVMFIHRLQGGDGANIFAMVAMILLSVYAPAIGAVLFGAQTAIGTALVLAGGALLIQALFPPDQPSVTGLNKADTESNVFANVSSGGNVLGRDAYLPIVVGSRRILPPDVVNPRAYLVGNIQTYERLFALDGQHTLSSVQGDGQPVTDFPTVATEIIEGDGANGGSTLVTDISVPTPINEVLPAFSLDSKELSDQSVPANSSPRWIQFTTPNHDDLNEINIRLRLDGLYKTDSVTQAIRMPIRVQFRAKGGGSGDWKSIPEIHIIGRTVSTKLIELRFRWDGDWGDFSTGGELSYEFWNEVPAVTAHTLSDGSSGTQWQAESWWDDGAGFQDTVNITDRRHDIRVDMSETVLAKGAYEWRIMRGYIVDDTALSSAYVYDSNVVSMFVGWVDGTNVIPLDQGSYTGSINAVQATSRASTQPVQWPATTLLGVVSSGQTIKDISVLAARYINDYDGASWITSTAASVNPASHYRQILFDYLTYHGMDTTLIDDTSMVAWRQECIDRGYECNGVFAGETVGETLSALATAGFARPRYSDGFGIEYFRDRSADIPVQTFSPRNTSDISFKIVNPERQFGYRVKFDNEDDEWRQDEIEVMLDNAADVNTWETLGYKAISSPTLVRRRAYFDLLQIDKRRREWTVEAEIEGLVCEMGDLVSVVTDLFDDKSHGARVKSVSDATHITLDQDIPVEVPPSVLGGASPPTVANMLDAGERSEIFISTPTGVVQRTIVGVDHIDSRKIRLDSGLPSTAIEGAHVNITNKANTQHRCFVVGINRKNEERATLTLVDEAPEIYDKIIEKFG